jgi:hypothetical protein
MATHVFYILARQKFENIESPRPQGFQGQRKSTRAIRWLGSDTRAVFLLDIKDMILVKDPILGLFLKNLIFL